MNDFVTSDHALLDLLRKSEAMTVAELAASLEVTSTAVRQRLVRLMAQDLVAHTSEKGGRGRPVHQYRLTSGGRRKAGANFDDLALALWDEIRSIDDIEIRRGLLKRISSRLASQYADQVCGESVRERMESVAQIFQKRGIPFEVVVPAADDPAKGDIAVAADLDSDVNTDPESDARLPVLTALACPYPELAEQDRGVCSMERLMMAELMGENVRLSECRLDGGSCCTFEVAST